jgi:hypothetical protein
MWPRFTPGKSGTGGPKVFAEARVAAKFVVVQNSSLYFN